MFFTNKQLEFIHGCSQQAVNIDNGELTVARLAREQNAGQLTDELLVIIDFCAGESERQGSRARSVFRMVQAYNRVLQLEEPLTDEIIVELGRLVEPVENQYGFACVPANFSTTDITNVRQPHNIPREIESLFKHGGDLSALELYVNFEDIHPFNDGNGRVGAIVYNLRNGTLLVPVIPPKFDFNAWHLNRQAPLESFVIS